MSAEPYRRKQGEGELRVLKDGRLVIVAPDEALLELAKAFERAESASGAGIVENEHGADGKPQRRPAGDR